MLMMWLAMVAFARPPGCPAVDVEDWREGLDAVDSAFQRSDVARARALLEAAEPRVPCLDGIVRAEMLARYARQRSFLAMMDVEGDEANRWYQLARVLEPEGGWPDYVPRGHAARQLGVEPPPPRGRAEGLGLVVPPGGGVFLDGRYMVAPEAEASVPHLLQVADDEGSVTFAAWIDGAVFPDRVLGKPTSVPPAPLWFTNPVDAAAQAGAVRSRRLRSAAALATTAGGLFVGAWVARGAYDDHPSDGLRAAVNGTAVGAGAAASGAAVMLTLAAVAR